MAAKVILLGLALTLTPLLFTHSEAAKKQQGQFATCECTCTSDLKVGVLRRQTKSVSTKVKIEGSEIPGESCDSLNGGGCRFNSQQTGTISACTPK
jgi:hypothetical protein